MNEANEKMIVKQSYWKSEFSCRFFLIVSALLFILYMVLSQMGYRLYTNLLSTTSKSDMTRGLFYIFSYLGFVVLLPILLIASTLLIWIAVFRKWIGKSEKNSN